MNLSKRLTRIRHLYDGAPTVWDIGCDHGLLGLSFLSETKVHSIHLVDPSRSVIEDLNLKLKDAYITIPEKIKVHFQKGQDIILGPERKNVFIAGMGGKEIIEIIDSLKGQLLEEDRLVISPHRKILEVRQWLIHSEFGLVSEEVILEDGQFYPVLCLAIGGGLPKVTPYGDSFWQTLEGKEYLAHQLRIFSQHKDTASQAYVFYLRSIKI